MYDSGKILTGLLLFVLVMTGPVWYNAYTGKGAYVPQPELPEGKCVESTPYMRAWHMNMLNTWRTDVVRNGLRTYVSLEGSPYTKSLTNTCMNCHKSKVRFCDRCHNYAGVAQPICWNCHNPPEETPQ
jgi:hypothetical protein